MVELTATRPQFSLIWPRRRATVKLLTITKRFLGGNPSILNLCFVIFIIPCNWFSFLIILFLNCFLGVLISDFFFFTWVWQWRSSPLPCSETWTRWWRYWGKGAWSISASGQGSFFLPCICFLCCTLGIMSCFSCGVLNMNKWNVCLHEFSFGILAWLQNIFAWVKFAILVRYWNTSEFLFFMHVSQAWFDGCWTHTIREHSDLSCNLLHLWAFAPFSFLRENLSYSSSYFQRYLVAWSHYLSNLIDYWECHYMVCGMLVWLYLENDGGPFRMQFDEPFKPTHALSNRSHFEPKSQPFLC